MDTDKAWENFLEAIASLMSKALTNKEAEKVIAGVDSFRDRLHRLSRYPSSSRIDSLPPSTDTVASCIHFQFNIHVYMLK